MPLHRELLQAIESGFLPLQCQCAAGSDGTLIVTITDAMSGDVELCVTGISTSALRSNREIAKLISELRAELQLSRTTFERSAVRATSQPTF